MQVLNDEVSKEVSEVTSTMPLSQAKQIYTAYKNKELAMPYQVPEENKNERVALGALQRWGQSLEVIPEGIGILGGEIMMLDGKILQNTPFKDVAQANMKLGEKLINAANSSLEAKRKRQAQELLPISEEESSSPLFKSVSTVTDYGSQILLALATGGTTALATMGARMAGETAVAGLEEYKQAHPEDKDLTGFLTTGNLSKEVLLNAGKTAINLYVEKAIGVPKQVSQFKKALKTPTTGAMGVLKAAGKGYAMGFGEEWATETIQGISDTTFDAFLGRFKDMPELAKAYNESVVDAVYAGIFGGGFGASGHVIARGKAIGQVKEMMSNVVPEQDLEMVATAIVDNHIASTKQLIGTQVQLSTELRDKHGEIFNAMNVAAKQAMMESGVANTMTEDEIAQHAVELSTLFADQVLAEANKRNVPIFDVINSKDIVYDPKTKELRLAPKKVVEAVRKIKEKKPTSLIQFIKNNGGIQDEHGELKALDALRQRPGLVSKKGMTLDEARRMAEEAGYFGTNAKNEGMTSTADFLDLIDKELRGQKVYTEEGQSTIDRIKEAETYDNSEEEDYYERNLLAKGVSEEELSQMNFDEKKQAYEMSKEEDGTYMGDDGLLHAADGSVLFQTDIAQRINEIDAEEQAKGVPEYTAPTININGVERQTTNSNGNPIAKSEKSLRYFYDWFGDSKVVDEQGRPLVVYHGTNAEFDTFDISKAGNATNAKNTTLGFFFTPHPQYAETLGENIIPVYLRTDNMFEVGYAKNGDVFLSGNKKERLNVSSMGRGNYEFVDGLEAIKSAVVKKFGEYNKENVAKWAALIKSMGYDGIKIMTGDTPTFETDFIPTAQYVVFDPNQIKSTSNRGTFSSSENIYLQSAFAGSRVDYDRPSLEAIGSGEGAQVHGYGLYYALSKDVAENYRKARISNVIKKFEYEGKPITHLRGTQIENATPEMRVASALVFSGVGGEYNVSKHKLDRLKDYYQSFIDNSELFDTEDWKKVGEENKKNLKAAQEFDISKIKDVSEKGQVHEVDIPESPYLLDEQKPFSEQSDYVKSILEKEDIVTPTDMSLEETLDYFLKKYAKGKQKETVEAIVNHFRENGDIEGFTYRMANGTNISYEDIHLLDYYNTTGKEIYEKLSKKLGSDKKASEYLESKGIKGITYFGQQDGRCFVIFNPDDVKVIQKFYQVTGLPREKATPKGTFDAKSKVIQLFEKADASTLDHELAHFWLDNMWTYANSGAASEQYMAQFNAVKDYLGVRPDQRYLTRSQHEKFASAYEKYIYRGDIPNSIMGNVFDNYERFIRNVYNSIQDIKAEGRKKVRLTPEIIKFFDSMIKGGIDTTAATETIASEVRNEEAQKADDVTMKESKEVVAEMPEREVQPEIKPVETEGKAKESRLYERMKGIVGDEGKLEYNVVEIKEQREKARKLWNENPEKARAILKGTEKAEDILRQALYTEQQRLALQNGDTNTFLTSLRKQSAEATRMGQELSALRGVVEDITDPAYWIRSAETEALKNLAKKQTKNLENAMGNSPLMELTARLDADIKALQKDVASKATDEEKTKAFKEGVKAIAEKYQGLEQPDLVLNQVDWSNEELADDYIETKVKEKLGIALPKETAKAFIQTARELDTLSRQRDEMGNPVDAFFAKKDELERMRNSHTPTSRTKVLISTIGRANMLTAPSTSVLNVVSNSLNYGAENVVRKVGNILEGKTNDNIVSKDLKDKYRAKAWKVFWETGYDMSFMSSLLDERLYKGESISHSEGDGAIRAVGRWSEKYVFSRLISTPDIYVKSVIGFTDYVGNEATDIAYKEGLTGDKAKARADELFKDAIKIEPETEQGKQIRAKAQTDALILTFQQDTKFARMLLDVRNAINKGTGDIGIGDILSPFIKTPANIISMGFDAAVGPFASPVNLIGALNDIKAKNYRSARVLQAAKQTTTATLAYTVIALLASMLIDDDDYIPDYAQLTQKERAAVRAKGGSFGSIKVGGEYISTDFFGPFEMPLVTFLNTRRTGNLIKGIAGGVASKAIDAPVLKDILGSSEAIKEMTTSKDDIISAIGENVANAAITRLTPNALNTMAKIIDGKERKTNTVAEKIAARIPFVRNQLPERLSVATGEAQEIQRLNTLLLGSRGKYEETAPLATEISRLASAGVAVNIVDPTRSGELAKLSDEEKSRIQDMFATEFAKKASKEIARPSYRRKSDEDKKDALDDVRKSVVSDIKRKYRNQLKVLKKTKK